MADNQGVLGAGAGGQQAVPAAPPAQPDASTTDAPQRRPAQLRVPTSTVAKSWWDPRYWSTARPTDFCYGDCVWGLHHQPVPLSIGEWAWLLWRREEMEYDVPGDDEPFIARPVNRFRGSWYVMHLVTSFWTRAETTKSVHTFLKTPGAFGYTRAVADITPEMLSDVLLKFEQAGRKPSIQSLLSDSDVPAQLRKALHAMHQSTANVMGSNGHRRLLQKEGVAYTLAYAAPLVFTTVNPADTKQPLLLLVQGGSWRLEEPLPCFREMTERLASDPAGQVFVFELLIRIFFVCVLGVRHDCVGWRRGEAKTTKKEWCTDGLGHDQMASTVFGWIQAAFGPVEAQGRGSLHPHILLWLLDLSVEEAVELLARDRAAFQENLRAWMRQVLAAVAATQETSVMHMARTWGCSSDSAPDGPPLPLGPKEKKCFWADGGSEVTTEADIDRFGVASENETLYFTLPAGEPEEDQWPEAIRPCMPLRGHDGSEVDATAWAAEFEEARKKLWSQPVSDTPPGKRPRYCSQHEFLTAHELNSEAVQELRAALPSDDFIREACADARDLVIGCAVHVCSPSCWKYHSNGKSQICRHNFYHVVVLVTEGGTSVKRRRQGKPLRGCLAICRDTRYGMAGRILTFQIHPWECPSNYAALLSLRCNIDVQDLRRVPPPWVWMLPEELEAKVGEEEESRHGAYPQRVRGFSTGPQPEWGWMKHLGTTEECRDLVLPTVNWHALLERLSVLPPVVWEELGADDATAAAMKASFASGRAIFIDAHNAGFYINSYTTKVNPTMDNVMRRLMEGIRRLHDAWKHEEENADTTITSSSRRAFRRTLQALNRFDTSFRRASWKSGCEMLFPIIFGHMSFQTHRCWCVFMKRAIWLTAEAWRRYYGQVSLPKADTDAAAPQFKLPSGSMVALPEGWRRDVQDGEVLYMDPDGTSYNEREILPLALAAFEQEKSGGRRGAALQALMRSLERLREGASEEPRQHPEDGVDATGADAAKVRYYSFDQLDDWHHRGTHPILLHMSLYEYSVWVYRVESSPYAVSTAQAQKKKPRHLDIPFDPEYSLGTTWTQRLSREPRVPRVEGMRFESLANPEMHYLLKSALLRPVFMGLVASTNEPSPSNLEPVRLRLLRSYEPLCTSSEGERLQPQKETFHSYHAPQLHYRIGIEM